MGGWGFVLVNWTPILAKIVRGRSHYPRDRGMDNVKSGSVPETVAVLRAVPRKCVCARVCAPLQWNFSNFAGLVFARSRERDGMMNASRTIIGLILGNKPLRVCCGARSLERNGKQNDSNCMKKLIKKHTQMNNYRSLSATSAGKSARARTAPPSKGWGELMLEMESHHFLEPGLGLTCTPVRMYRSINVTQIWRFAQKKTKKMRCFTTPAANAFPWMLLEKISLKVSWNGDGWFHHRFAPCVNFR